MALGIVNEMFPLVDARVSVGVIATGVVICYAHYVSITINEICDGLGIR